jgi:hypothetical protein
MVATNPPNQQQDQQQHRQAALGEVAELLTLLQQQQQKQQPPSEELAHLVELTEHLQRAVQAFHLEAIRFRMYSLDRALTAAAPQMPDAARTIFERIRHELEAAGFSTRSH